MQQPQTKQPQNQEATPPAEEKQKTPSIPRITVRENKEGNLYLVASSLKGLGLDGLKEALAKSGNEIGKMNPKNFSFSFSMTPDVIEYLNSLPEGSVEFYPAIDSVLKAENHVNFDSNIGWLESTDNDGGVNATIRIGFNALSNAGGNPEDAAALKEMTTALKEAGMKYDGSLQVWSGPVTTDNVLALNGLGLEWAQDFQDMTINVGAPEAPEVPQQQAEPQAPQQQEPGM